MQRLLTEDEYQELVHRGDMASEDMQEHQPKEKSNHVS